MVAYSLHLSPCELPLKPPRNPVGRRIEARKTRAKFSGPILRRGSAASKCGPGGTQWRIWKSLKIRKYVSHSYRALCSRRHGNSRPANQGSNWQHIAELLGPRHMMAMVYNVYNQAQKGSHGTSVETFPTCGLEYLVMLGVQCFVYFQAGQELLYGFLYVQALCKVGDRLVPLRHRWSAQQPDRDEDEQHPGCCMHKRVD